MKRYPIIWELIAIFFLLVNIGIIAPLLSGHWEFWATIFLVPTYGLCKTYWGYYEKEKELNS